MRSLVVGSSRGKLIFALAFAACTLALTPWPALAGGAARTAELKAGATLKRIAVIDLPGPPGRRFDYAPPFHKVYVSNERAKAESVIDVREDKIVKVLRFDSETGVPQYDPIARKVYVNLQDENVLAVIDPATDTVVGRYPVEGCQGNHGMALDPEHHRAFLACQGNDVLTVFNLDTPQAIAHLPMAKGADVVVFDPGLGRIYVACASGAISVFQEEDPDHFTKLEDLPVEKKVHSLAVDLHTHRVYAPEEQENGQPVARMVIFEAIAGAPAAPPEAAR